MVADRNWRYGQQSWLDSSTSLIGSEQLEPNREPEGSAQAHPHRLSEPTAMQIADAIVESGDDQNWRNSMPQPFCQPSRIDHSSSNTGPRQLEPKGTRGKERLSDKYLAGLLDADGCVQLLWQPPMENCVLDRTKPELRAYAMVSFNQNGRDRNLMELIANSLTPPSAEGLWGYVAQRSGTNQFSWMVNGKRAVSVLMRLRKYLVIKRALADYAIDINGKVLNVKDTKQRWDVLRGASPMPKHPTRKWTAGYLDGDGCFKVHLQRGMGATVLLVVVSEAKLRVGVDLLQKAYGGTVQEAVSEEGTPFVTWVLCMDAAKVRSIFESGKGGVAKHMILKNDQAYFILACAKMGHFRDGVRIQTAMRQLQDQPHRLNGPGADVARLLETVRDVPSFKGPDAQERKRQWDAANGGAVNSIDGL